MTATLRQSISFFISRSTFPAVLVARVAPSKSPQASRNPRYIPPVLNATTRGTFLPSLFSLSSQCRFAVSRGEVVERRKQERLGRRKRKEKTIERAEAFEGSQEATSLSVYRSTATWKRSKRPRALITGWVPFIFRSSFSAFGNHAGEWCGVSVSTFSEYMDKTLITNNRE